jgi:hypothetical protein
MKKYVALVDTGRTLENFEFYSEFRADSKKNSEDLRSHLLRTKGRFTRNWEVMDIWRIEE